MVKTSKYTFLPLSVSNKIIYLCVGFTNVKPLNSNVFMITNFFNMCIMQKLHYPSKQSILAVFCDMHLCAHFLNSFSSKYDNTLDIQIVYDKEEDSTMIVIIDAEYNED